MLASAGFGSSVTAALALLACGIALGWWAWTDNRRALAFAAISIFIIAGHAYYRFDDARFRNLPVPYGAGTFQGEVYNEPERAGDFAFVTVKVSEFGGARIRLTVPKYPAFAYGDTLKVKGKIEALVPPWRAGLEKDRVRGTVAFPEVEVVSQGGGSFVYRALYGLRRGIITGLYSALPAREAALAAGLLVGDTSGFSPDFKEAMKAGGTTHLTALSGYNIMVVAGAAGALFISFLGRRAAFGATLLVILGFVAATGAQASAVRAAIMAGILLLAGQVGRAYDPRNAIAAAGTLMILANPKSLAFDLGFQLSFLALLGITYVRPALLGFIGIRVEKSFTASLYEALAATVAAQLSVLPALWMGIGSFAVLSFIPNVLLAPIIPIAMGLGFAAALSGCLSAGLGSAVGLIAHPVLSLASWLIEAGGKYSWTVTYAAGIPIAILYAALLAYGTAFGLRRAKAIKRLA